ncbi:MAG TPA: hypothetical protein VME20_06565 [Acidimicrobiales bacterium]|nr:hypothetical protein [Acidimicrobiales bacterium]
MVRIAHGPCKVLTAAEVSSAGLLPPANFTLQPPPSVRAFDEAEAGGDWHGGAVSPLKGFGLAALIVVAKGAGQIIVVTSKHEFNVTVQIPTTGRVSMTLQR